MRISRFEVKKDNYPGYNIWALALTEVELDVLTGEMRVVRADLVEDAGLSTSPAVDIGQVEGAFVMGMGLWTSEEMKYDPETGELLTCNSWEYKPPAAKDIPQDFRVTLLRNARNPVGALSSKGAYQSSSNKPLDSITCSYRRASHLYRCECALRHQGRPQLRQAGARSRRLVGTGRTGHCGAHPTTLGGQQTAFCILIPENIIRDKINGNCIHINLPSSISDFAC